MNPFGQEYGTAGGSPANVKYTGQWKDANTGLYYLYRRFYDPALGRFLLVIDTVDAEFDPCPLRTNSVPFKVQHAKSFATASSIVRG